MSTTKTVGNKSGKNNTSKVANKKGNTGNVASANNKAIKQPAATKQKKTTNVAKVVEDTKASVNVDELVLDKEVETKKGKTQVKSKPNPPVKPKPAIKTKPVASKVTKEQKEPASKEDTTNLENKEDIEDKDKEEEVRPNRKSDLVSAQQPDSKNTKKTSIVNKVKKSIWSLNIANNAYKNGQYIKYDEIKNVTSLVVISKRTIDNFNNYKNDNDSQIPLLFINKDSQGNNIRLALYHNGSELDVANKVLNSFYSESEIKALVNNSINYTNFDEKILLNDIRERTSGGSSNRLPVPISELLFSADPKSFRNCVVIGADGTEKYMRRDKSDKPVSSITGNSIGNKTSNNTGNSTGSNKQRTNLIQQLTEALETMYRIMYDETTTSRSKSSTKKYVNIDTLNADGSGTKIGSTAKSVKLTFNKEEDGEIIKGYYPIVCTSSIQLETARQLITSEPLTSWKAGSEDRDFLLENLNKLSLQFTNKGRKKMVKPSDEAVELDQEVVETTLEEQEDNLVVNIDLDDKVVEENDLVDLVSEQESANTLEQDQDTAIAMEQEQEQEQEETLVQKLSSPVMNTVSNLSPQRKRRGVNRR